MVCSKSRKLNSVVLKANCDGVLIRVEVKGFLIK